MATILKIILISSFASSLLMSGFSSAGASGWRRVGILLSGAGSALYALGYFVEIGANNASELTGAYSVSQIGAGLVPLGIFLVISEICGLEDHRTRRMAKAMASICAVMIAVNVTGEFHSLAVGGVDFTVAGGITVAGFDHGIVTRIHAVYAMMACASMLLFSSLRFPGLSEGRRREAVLLFAAAGVPGILIAINASGLAPFGLRLAPFFALMLPLALSAGRTRERSESTAAVMACHLFSTQEAAVAIFDTRDNLVKWNDSLSTLVGIETGSLGGLSSSEVFKGFPRIAALVLRDADHGNAEGCDMDVSLIGPGERVWPWEKEEDGLEWITELKGEKVALRDSKTGRSKAVIMSKHTVWDRDGHLAGKCIVIDDVTTDARYAGKTGFLA